MKELLNFYQSTVLVGTCGQPTVDQFIDIAEQGYSTVINLAMHDSENAVKEEGNIVASLGMSYIHMPVPFDAPDIYHFKRFCQLMDVVDGEKVLVHCAVNARVSAFMHQYLTLTKGFESAQVSSPLLNKWRPRMDNVWGRFMAFSKTDLE